VKTLTAGEKAELPTGLDTPARGRSAHASSLVTGSFALAFSATTSCILLPPAYPTHQAIEDLWLRETEGKVSYFASIAPFHSSTHRRDVYPELHGRKGVQLYHSIFLGPLKGPFVTLTSTSVFSFPFSTSTVRLNIPSLPSSSSSSSNPFRICASSKDR